MLYQPQLHDFIIDGNVFHDIGRTKCELAGSRLVPSRIQLHGYQHIFYNIPHGWSIRPRRTEAIVLIANNTFAFPNGGGQDGQIILWNTQSNLTIRDNIF